MKKQSLAALALIAGSIGSAPALADDCDVYVYGPDNGVHSGGAGYDVTLWPPNHKMTTVALGSTKDCDVDITGVFQDEAVDEPGSGNTTEFDAANCQNGGDEASVQLRAERSGRGNGRFYEIDYSASHYIETPAGRIQDPSRTETGTVVVLVPHDQRRDQTQWENELEAVEDDARTPSASGMVCSDVAADEADETSNPANGRDTKKGKNKG